MSPLRLTALFAALFGVATAADVTPRPSNEEWKEQRAADDAKAADEAASEGKRSAVDKVITLLVDLQQKVLQEGESEAAAYNEFACFCKTDQKAKKKAIKQEQDAKESLTAAINELATGRDKDDDTIKALEKENEMDNKKMEDKTKVNKGELKKYAEAAADLSGAIAGIEGALQTLIASKPSLLQLQTVSTTVREAMAMADALGLGSDSAAFLQDDPEVEIENYKFHSGSVIKTLEQLLGKFRTKKADLDSEEVQRLKEHDMFMQEMTDRVKAKTVEIESTQKDRDDKIAEIASKSQQLTTESANLMDDQTYLKELYRMCKNKAETWDKRSQVRADELSAITAATVIIKDQVREKTDKGTLRFAQLGVSVRMAEAVAHNENAMEAVEAAAEEKEGQTSSSMSFLQRKSEPGSADALSRISAVLRKSKSTMLTALASQIASETLKPKGMEKVKTLISELIDRLQTEMANEATQKGWCDKAMGDAKTKRAKNTATVNELNDSMAKLEADRKLLADILATLAKDIKDLKDAQKEADKLREAEKKENEAAIKNAEEGETAVDSAIKILADFYKDAAKNKDEKSGKNKDTEKVDSPDAGFEGGEAYTGDQSSASGVLGMLDVIKSDFARTVAETTTAEANSADDHTAFTTQTTATIKEKEDIETARQKEKDDADSEFDTQKKSFKETMDRLVSNVKELIELKATCVDTAMSYEERVARRDDEIASLRKALCILSAFANYGATPAMYDQCA